MNARFVIASLLVLAPSAFADTLVLKNGAEISGMLVGTQEKNSKDSSVTIRVAGGEITLASSMIRETRKDATTAETMQRAEEDAKAKAAAANQERRERMAIAAAAFDAVRPTVGEARAASFGGAAPMAETRITTREKSIEELGSEIEAKLELLRDFERRGLGNRTGFQEQQRLRRAILDELFPNQRPQPIVW